MISGPIDLGALNLTEGTGAVAIANSQQLENTDDDPVMVSRIAGWARDNGNSRSVLWEITSSLDEKGIPQLAVQSGPNDLGTLPGDTESSPRGMNNNGDVYGTPGFMKIYDQPMIPLADLKHTQSGGLSSPNDINDLTEIVGKFYYGVGEQATVLWQADGTPTDLNKFTGGTEWSYLDNATAINNLGAIAGWGTRFPSGKKNSPRVIAAFIMIPK